MKEAWPSESEPAPSRLSGWSAAAVATLGAIYLGVLTLGLVTTPAGRAISDPWFTAMEALILMIAPAMVVMIAALSIQAPAPSRAYGALATAFMAVAMALTCAVHFSILVLARTPEFSGPEWAVVFSFQWPSLAYVLDILAWDFFFPLALLCILPVIPERSIRRLILLAAVLALVGLLGPFLDMRIRDVGILGYAVVFPFAAALLAARAFHAKPAKRQASFLSGR